MALTSCGAGELALRLWEYAMALDVCPRPTPIHKYYWYVRQQRACSCAPLHGPRRLGYVCRREKQEQALLPPLAASAL